MYSLTGSKMPSSGLLLVAVPGSSVLMLPSRQHILLPQRAQLRASLLQGCLCCAYPLPPRRGTLPQRVEFQARASPASAGEAAPSQADDSVIVQIGASNCYSVLIQAAAPSKWFQQVAAVVTAAYMSVFKKLAVIGRAAESVVMIVPSFAGRRRLRKKQLAAAQLPSDAVR